MALNSNTEDLMSLIFGSSENNQEEGTVLDWIDESFDSQTEVKASDVSQSTRFEDTSYSNRVLLNIIEED